MKADVFSMNHTTPSNPGSSVPTQPSTFSRPKVGPSGPPKNSVTMIADIVTTFMNSASMNMPKRSPEYSVRNPATSSPSASGRSNGGRPASATMPTRNTTNAGNSGSTYQFGMPVSRPSLACAAMMSETRSEPV